MINIIKFVILNVYLKLISLNEDFHSQQVKLMWTPGVLSLFMIKHPYLDNLNNVEIYNALKKLYLEYILSKFQVFPTTASLCHNVVSHKKVKKWGLKKRGLATTVQPEPEFSRTCGFREVLGINEDC